MRVYSNVLSLILTCMHFACLLCRKNPAHRKEYRHTAPPSTSKPTNTAYSSTSIVPTGICISVMHEVEFCYRDSVTKNVNTLGRMFFNL